MTGTITLDEFYKSVQENGHIFSVEFIKRGDGKPRLMVCRTGVTKDTHGGSMGYDPKNHGLLPVYDMQAKGFRSIPIGSITRVSMGGTKYTRNGHNLIPIQTPTCKGSA